MSSPLPAHARRSVHSYTLPERTIRTVLRVADERNCSQSVAAEQLIDAGLQVPPLAPGEHHIRPVGEGFEVRMVVRDHKHLAEVIDAFTKDPK